MYFQEFLSSIVDLSNGLFLVYLIISGNYLADVFSCKTQNILSNNRFLKQFLAFTSLLFFVLYQQETDYVLSHPGITFLKAFILYIWFFLTTKTHHVALFIIFLLILVIVLLDKFEKYFRIKHDEEKSNDIKIISKYLGLSSLIITVVGFIINFYKKRMEYKNNWSWKTYIFGIEECLKN